MTKEKAIKLPIGQKNVVIKTCPTRKAEGVSLTKGYEGQKDRTPKSDPFNTPVLCITLRKGH